MADDVRLRDAEVVGHGDTVAAGVEAHDAPAGEQGHERVPTVGVERGAVQEDGGRAAVPACRAVVQDPRPEVRREVGQVLRGGSMPVSAAGRTAR